MLVYQLFFQFLNAASNKRKNKMRQSYNLKMLAFKEKIAIKDIITINKKFSKILS